MKRQAWLSVVAALAFSGCVSGAGAPLSRVPEAPLKTTGEVSKGSEGPPVELVELPSADARLDVPGFDGATAWLNVDHALSKEELKGRVVVVDFWTSCCINCLHTIPTLQKIEERFRGQPVVVIGVHSPKFEEEQKVERLRDFLRGSGIEHPIAVDAEMAIWRAWGVEGWPTVAVLDVAGRAIWAASGEPGEDELTRVVASALEEGRGQGKLARGELPGVRAEKETAGALRYPGKVLALESGGLAIADTGHNRVVLLDKGGRVEAVVGSGQKGKLDGAFADASFNQPEGMTESGGDLYVADTYNHLIRKIDLRARAVTTVAGTGELGAGPLARDEKPALSLPLRSPWDLLDIKGTIYVAMAGTHQIAAFDPRRKSIRLFAGNGREARVDGPLLEAAFAQPNALATDGKEIFVLDSETSSVRAIDAAKGQVRTVVGLDLFVFGDVDGDRTTTRLQHPIGMTFADGAVWVADSYNSKVKRIDPRTGVTRTALGGADRRELAEPAGIAAQGSRGAARGDGEPRGAAQGDRQPRRSSRLARLDPDPARRAQPDPRPLGDPERHRRERGGALPRGLDRGPRPHPDPRYVAGQGRRGERRLRSADRTGVRGEERLAHGRPRHGGLRSGDARRLRAGAPHPQGIVRHRSGRHAQLARNSPPQRHALNRRGDVALDVRTP
jgi:thiol-disulfide isomerase/thioredoxin/sugar lactone lactonase YvrE